MKIKYNKLYEIAIDYGTHRGLISTTQICFTIWIQELAKEFKIYTETKGKRKMLYIYNYWGDKQEVGYIYTM